MYKLFFSEKLPIADEPIVVVMEIHDLKIVYPGKMVAFLSHCINSSVFSNVYLYAPYHLFLCAFFSTKHLCFLWKCALAALVVKWPNWTLHPRAAPPLLIDTVQLLHSVTYW